MKPVTVGLMIFVLAVFPLAAPSAADEPWPAFRGPGTTGVSAEQLPEGDGPLAFELVWKRPLGSAYSGISIAQGLLVTGYSDGEHDFVGAFDPETGEEVWHHAFAPHYKGHDGSHDGTTATPSISGGRVFMASPWGHLVALDLATGESLWTRHMIEDFGGEKPLYGFAASPLVVGDSVVMGVCSEKESIVALDAGSGEVVWRSLDRPCVASQNSPVLTEIGGAPQIVVLAPSGVLTGLDPATGSQSWEFKLEGRPGPMGSISQSPLALGGDRLFIKHQDGEAAVVALAEGAEGLTPFVVASGRGLARSYSPPTRWGNTLYGYSSRLLSAVDPTTGDLLWRSREPGDGFLLAVDGQLAVITKTGSLHLGAASPEGWQESARIELFDDLAWTPPSFADGSIYVRSLGEMARVRLVRRAMEMTAEASAAEIPAALAGLAGEVAKGDASVAVDRFLEGRELPLVDGTEVTFLWRGGDDVAIGGDMIGMRREEPMHRLEGSDLWWWSTELDRRARMSYLFFVDDKPATDPSHQRITTATILGPDMNWKQGESVDTSWFAMPEWPGLAIEQGAGGDGGRLETIKVPFQPPTPDGEEAPDPVEITMHVWLPPGYDQSGERYPAVYLHHQDAMGAGGWPETLDRVVGRSVAPLIAVFTEWPRIRQYPTRHVVESIDERFRTRNDRDSRANIGMAWGGIPATMNTFGDPEMFGVLGLQSLFLLEGQMAVIEGAIGDATADTLSARIYIEFGKWDLISPHEEMNMRRSGKWAFDLFASKGWEPMGGEVWDSTDFSSWKNRTGAMLQALFPLEGAPDTLSVWQTGAP